MPEPCPPPASAARLTGATASAAREARAFELGRDPRGAGEAPGAQRASLGGPGGLRP